jgi:hypothetical protein
MGEAICGNSDWEKVTKYDMGKDVTHFEKWVGNLVNWRFTTQLAYKVILGNFTQMENKKAKFVIC